MSEIYLLWEIDGRNGLNGIVVYATLEVAKKHFHSIEKVGEGRYLIYLDKGDTKPSYGLVKIEVIGE